MRNHVSPHFFHHSDTVYLSKCCYHLIDWLAICVNMQLNTLPRPFLGARQSSSHSPSPWRPGGWSSRCRRCCWCWRRRSAAASAAPAGCSDWSASPAAPPSPAGTRPDSGDTDTNKHIEIITNKYTVYRSGRRSPNSASPTLLPSCSLRLRPWVMSSSSVWLVCLWDLHSLASQRSKMVPRLSTDDSLCRISCSCCFKRLLKRTCARGELLFFREYR